jgi:hypothetical protein
VATIHFVKDGKKSNGERLTRSTDVHIDAATKHLGRFSSRHTEKPPTLNPEVLASDFAPYKHVVLEAKQDETNTSFPKAGFYYIVGLDPAECQRLLGLSGPMS